MSLFYYVRLWRSGFKGEHVVDCCFVKEGVVVFCDRIGVPNSNISVKLASVSWASYSGV
ncbi:hypothetical protein ABZ512_13040 [Nocardiopsis dassonvillei]|uniref:nucleotide-binding domain-containing protein n=1 Tax=Nocardiopsis dassonvillei TaxID=2014 RepID=UPI0033E4C634